jgi:hypothetical protein
MPPVAAQLSARTDLPTLVACWWATPRRAQDAWTDSGKSRERRGLKHRAANDTRPVPAHPELVEILSGYLGYFGSVTVLLRVYAKCIVGQEDAAAASNERWRSKKTGERPHEEPRNFSAYSPWAPVNGW